jgi:hypothetical protein
MCLIAGFGATANNYGADTMNWDALEAISAFVASIATLMTLIYLAIQIRESNKIARSASLKSVLDDFIEYSVINTLNHPELAEIFDRGHMDYDALTEREKSAFEAMLTRDILQLQNAMQQNEHGLLSDTDYQAWLAYVSGQLISPGGKKGWGYIKRAFTPTVVSALDGYIESNPSAISFADGFAHRRFNANDSEALD